MIEKRFVYEEEHFPIALMQIRDTQNNKTYDLEDACKLLNEQETRIALLEKGILQHQGLCRVDEKCKMKMVKNVK